MRYLALIMAFLLPSTASAGQAAKRMMMATGSNHGTINLNANGTYSKTGPATVNTVLDGDGVNHYFTISFPPTITSVSVTAAGAAGAIWGSNAGGRGCIITASGVPVSGQITAKIGVKPADNSYSGGYGGGSGYAGSATYGEAGGGGSTSLATTSGNTILIEAGAGNGASGGGVGNDALGDGGGVQDATHGNRPGVWYSEGGGWTVTSQNPLQSSSKIVSPATGSYATGVSGNGGAGYMTIVY